MLSRGYRYIEIWEDKVDNITIEENIIEPILSPQFSADFDDYLDGDTLCGSESIEEIISDEITLNDDENCYELMFDITIEETPSIQQPPRRSLVSAENPLDATDVDAPENKRKRTKFLRSWYHTVNWLMS